MNDLPKTSKLKTRLFANGTTLTFSAKTYDELFKNLNSELVIIDNWMKINKLSVKNNKSKYMIFTRKKRTPTDLKFGRTTIEEVSQIKYLEIVIGNKLTWESHIHQLCSKVSKGSWALLKLRKYDIKTLLSVYYSLVHSHLPYCITAWGSAFCNSKCFRFINKNAQKSGTDYDF